MQKSVVIQFVTHKSTGTALSEGKPIINTASFKCSSLCLLACVSVLVSFAFVIGSL